MRNRPEYMFVDLICLVSELPLVLHKLSLPHMVSTFVPDLRLKEAVCGGSLMMGLQLRLPKLEKREEHC